MQWYRRTAEPVATSPQPEDTTDDRDVWLDAALRLATPVLEAAAERRLRADMPIETGPAGDPEERAAFAHLEAVGRLLAGIAPWLELPDAAGGAREVAARGRIAELAREAIRSGIDPASPDRWNVETGPQPLVDAAFLALRPSTRALGALPKA